MKVLLSVVALLMIPLGTGWLIFPETMLGSAFGVHTDAVGVYMCRRYGAVLLGYATVLFLSLAGLLTRTIAGGARVAAVTEAVWTAGFLYYFVTGPNGD